MRLRALQFHGPNWWPFVEVPPRAVVGDRRYCGAGAFCTSPNGSLEDNEYYAFEAIVAPERACRWMLISIMRYSPHSLVNPACSHASQPQPPTSSILDSLNMNIRRKQCDQRERARMGVESVSSCGQ